MRTARTVFIKELREMLRDRRSLLVAFIVPLLIMPVIFVVIAITAQSREKSDREEVLPVGLINTVAVPGLPEAIGAKNNLRPRSFALREDAEQALREQKVRAVLVVPVEAAGAFDEGRAAPAEILFDGGSDKSRTARDRLERVVQEVAKAEQLRRLERQGLNRTLLDPFDLTSTNLATPQRTGGFILGTILPYVVVLWTVFGGMTAAFDLCAGEKERGTMETLLVSSASRRQIIAGKVGAVWVLSVVSALFSLIGMVFSLSGTFRALAHVQSETIEVSYTSVAVALVTVIPLGLMMSSLLLVISTFARNQKEAQTYVMPVTMLALVAAMLSMILGQENALGLALVPVLNTALAMKQVLAGTFNIPFLSMALVSSIGYALLALKLVVSMFDRETVLFRA